ncbi:MAG: Short chain dehydrogenase [Candidatus Kaiserbacteria bacterium GW2011_GWC2_52_8b]|uniref:Short chain dehydrogenase n=2 Tax=Candidatus Kaiseribacteriota TaxID=1752734 RepID=A0A0G2AFZ5_9BACT|nr:MAG: Short chain dehydrogenase [Candidatus Kaiserbacteria bacterium GW2011_GWA2_52_12]KKW31449.1 MAG: Short chain dehydrogenase [Candidatus Kaiserbacteria bacterium GW2011_GWC2_52_8b]
MVKAQTKKPLNSNTYCLKDRSVLITGANGQLGSAYVRHFLRNSAFVYITDIQDMIGTQLEKELKKRNLIKWKYFSLDVTDENSIRSVADTIGSLDVLINNAGIGAFTPFEERTVADIDRVMDINIKGTILCCQMFSQKMGKASQGSIINIGSIYGVVAADKRIYGDSGRNSSEIYAATKAGVIHMTKYLAAYLGDKNIRVNSVSPGGVFADQKQFFIDNYVEKTPLGKMAQPDDIAPALLFLASADARYITGQNLTVDGGFSLNQ